MPATMDHVDNRDTGFSCCLERLRGILHYRLRVAREAMRCQNGQGNPEPPAANTPAYRGGPDARR